MDQLGLVFLVGDAAKDRTHDRCGDAAAVHEAATHPSEITFALGRELWAGI
jgi:hypothetical protein